MLMCLHKCVLYSVNPYLRLRVVLRTEYSKEYGRGLYWGVGGRRRPWALAICAWQWLFVLAVAICSYLFLFT